VVVIEDPELNACAFESGHIVVCSGLMNFLDDEELAFVIAHEMAHLKARHCSERWVSFFLFVCADYCKI
jgi:Zn-dependent protease with chaperone function